MFKIGWAKPVPVNMKRFKNPKRGMALTALAGPASNIVLSCVFLIIYGFTRIPLAAGGRGMSFAVSEMIKNTAYISVALAVFNIIPVPPLDGSKILFSLMSDEAYYKLMRYERFGMIILIILVMTGAVGGPLSTAIGCVYDRLFDLAVLAFRFSGRFF
ncbi:MAG: site-2 protease family protein, partial [Oscillospiraceae bacterium]|nr:site-2 protease family protein [Oscillospiraceae bacterium]